MTMMVLSWLSNEEVECRLDTEAHPVAKTRVASAIHAAIEAKIFFMFPSFCGPLRTILLQRKTSDKGYAVRFQQVCWPAKGGGVV